MDIDGSNNTGQGPQQQNSNDIEQSFLQQFSCLGTTDHDELGKIFLFIFVSPIYRWNSFK